MRLMIAMSLTSHLHAMLSGVESAADVRQKVKRGLKAAWLFLRMVTAYD